MSEQLEGARIAHGVRLYKTPVLPVSAAVLGEGPQAGLLRRALEAMGCRVTDQWRSGLAAFAPKPGTDFQLTARDETGALLSQQQLLTLVALIELENGGGRLAVPAAASAAIDLAAAGYGGQVLRLGKDGRQAEELYRAQPWMRDGVWGAARICARMGLYGERLDSLIRRTPRFCAWGREVPLRSDSGQVLDALAQEHGRSLREDGLSLRTAGGWVHLTPSEGRAGLRVTGESPDLELAAELCDFYAARAADVDRRISEQNIQDSAEK